MTEKQLRALLQSDPARGEKAVFDEYYSYVYAIAFRQLNGTGTREDVEECVIDVFLEVFQRIDSIQDGSLKAYIGMTARNQAIDRSRSLSVRNKHTTTLDEKIASPQDVTHDAEQAELSRRVYNAIRNLGEPDAAILIHKFYYGRNAVQIAKILGMKPSTVRNRCARALQKLQSVLDDLV